MKKILVLAIATLAGIAAYAQDDAQKAAADAAAAIAIIFAGDSCSFLNRAITR